MARSRLVRFLIVLAACWFGPPDHLRQGYGGPPKLYAKAEGGHYGAVAVIAQDQPRLTFRGGTSLRVITVTVTDQSGRPIEVPRSRPIEFEGLADVGMELNGWPLRHVVKCLAFYHVDDAPYLRERQEQQLLRLFSACRATGHELLLEIIAPADMPADEHTTARALERL